MRHFRRLPICVVLGRLQLLQRRASYNEGGLSAFPRRLKQNSVDEKPPCRVLVNIRYHGARMDSNCSAFAIAPLQLLGQPPRVQDICQLGCGVGRYMQARARFALKDLLVKHFISFLRPGEVMHQAADLRTRTNWRDKMADRQTDTRRQAHQVPLSAPFSLVLPSLSSPPLSSSLTLTPSATFLLNIGTGTAAAPGPEGQ
eukprot:GHVU01195200.1.p1 GENE.GHVU01195200.1~~GHVU01195200.1.p1  ORF type:complete len:200 (-),score=18.06 GHVU01195200.1:62-661(-)